MINIKRKTFIILKMENKFNEIRTKLLLIINCEIDNNINKIEFKSLKQKKNCIENFKIEFKEFYQGNTYDNNIFSNKLFQFDSPSSELNTNPVSGYSNNSKKIENKKECILPIKYLYTLVDELKSEKPLKRKVKKSKSN